MARQSELFPSEEQRRLSAEIPGLLYVADFISDDDETELISEIDSAPSWSNAMRRRVQHYGFRYDYRSHAIDETMRAAPFPSWLRSLAARIAGAGLLSQIADQAIVNEYLPGQGIAGHVDCEPCFGPEVVSISLGSGCEMQLVHLRTGQTVPYYLDRRSVIRLSGSARYEWRHGIPARQSDWRQGQKVRRDRRLSITFRTVILNH